MLQGWVIFIASVAYLGLLFAIAFWGDKRADQGRSVINNPYIYALSMAVFCTSWTFYGSVGRAATSKITSAAARPLSATAALSASALTSAESSREAEIKVASRPLALPAQ